MHKGSWTLSSSLFWMYLKLRLYLQQCALGARYRNDSKTTNTSAVMFFRRPGSDRRTSSSCMRVVCTGQLVTREGSSVRFVILMFGFTRASVVACNVCDACCLFAVVNIAGAVFIRSRATLWWKSCQDSVQLKLFFFFFFACRVFSAVTGHLSERGKSFRPAAVLKKLPDQCSSFHGAQSDKYGLIGQAFGLCSGHLCCFAAPLCPLQKKNKTSASCSLDETSLSNELFLKLVLPFFNLAWHPG